VFLAQCIIHLLQNLLTHPQLHQQRQICDVLNNRKERVPLAVSVFKERLKHREKDVVLRTLEVPPSPGELALEARLALMVACVLCMFRAVQLLDAVTKNVPER
jgi:hypothetical protein